MKPLLEQYRPDVFRDREEIYRLKEVIEQLPEIDKIILLMYVELQSYKELSKILGVSPSTCFWVVKDIKERIKKCI